MGSMIEKMGLRDDFPGKWISNHRRTWGKALGFTDLDALWVPEDEYTMPTELCGIEWSYGRCVALSDWKHRNADGHLDFQRDYNLLAQQDLGDRAGLPFFVFVYWHSDPKRIAFKVVPGNDLARKYVRRDFSIMTERGAVRLLYKLRNQTVPKEVEEACCKILPKDLKAEKTARQQAVA